MKKIFVMLLGAMMALSLSSCDEILKNTDDNTIEDEDIIDEGVIKEDYLELKRYNINQETTNPSQVKESFKDDLGNFYYYFDLGYIENVPLENNSDLDYEYYDASESNIVLKRNICDKASIEASIADITSKKGISLTEDLKKYFKGEIQIGFSNKDKFEEKISYNLEKAIGDRLSISSKAEAILDAVDIINNSEEVYVFEFNDTYPEGYYRYILSGRIHSYISVVINKATNKTYIRNDYFLDDARLSLDYSKDKFFNDEDEAKLRFDYTALKELNEPKVTKNPWGILNPESNDNKLPTIDETNSKIYDGGTGTRTDPFIIKGVSRPALNQFLDIRYNLKKHFKLEVDIDFKDYSLITECLIYGNFIGSLDGGGHKLSNLNSNYNHELLFKASVPFDEFTYLMGLFERVDGSISNLNIDNFNMYLEPYHDSNESYSFGLVAACGKGTFENIKISNSKLKPNRRQSTAGGIVGVLKGYVNNCTIEGCEMLANGDLGGIAGRVYGSIKNSVVKNTSFYYYYCGSETSMGGFGGYMRASSDSRTSPIIEACNIYDSTFTLHNNKKNWYEINTTDPKLGYIIGHAGEGAIHNVGMLGCHNGVEYGDKGKYYFTKGWGYAGKQDGGVDVI